MVEKQIPETIRDTHPGFVDATVGTYEEIKGKIEKKCLKNAHRKFAQGIQCLQYNSVNVLLSLQDTVMVVHSPLGCAACGALRGIERLNVYKHHMGQADAKESRIISTALGEKEVILGGETRLKETIDEAVARHHPKIVFILSSCAAAIIGDDIDAVAEKMEKKYKSEGILFAPVHCEGFKAKNHATGYDLALATIQNYVIRLARPPKKKGLINLFTPHTVSYADQIEMKRMLKAIGLDANVMPYNATYQDIMNIPAAEYNISVCQIYADDYMRFLKEKYGIPFAKTCMPVGTRSTDLWLRSIAKIAGKEKEAEEFIARERAAVMDEINEIKKKTQGLKAFITAGTGRGFAAATIIGDYGMKLLAMHTPYYEDAYIDDFKLIEELHGSGFLINVAEIQPYQQVNLVRKYNPDIFIGLSIWTSRLGINTTHILDPKRFTFGYRGALYLGRKISDALSNNNFNRKLSKHTRLPYRDSWFEEDAFKYVEFPEE